MATGKLLRRIVVGGLFVGHGLQKLRGVFGGPGLEGTEQMMEKLEMRPAAINARAVALAETVGGAAIILGAATPFAAAALTATMATATRKVHLSNGLWNSDGGFEYNAVLTSAVTALAADGPGRISVDAAFGRRRWGTGWGLFALVAGLAGSVAVTELAKRAPRPSGPGAASTEADPAETTDVADTTPTTPTTGDSE